MATLTGNQVKDTYRSLLKLEDNGSLSANLKIVQDGIGNSTPLSLSTTAVVSSVNVEAPGYKTPGGTSSQFLKADGSVDTNTYITSVVSTDTLDSVTDRGNSTPNSITVGGLFSGSVVTDTLEVQFGLLDATNSKGSNGQVLSSTGTWTEWIDNPQVSLTGAGATSIAGTFPNFTISSTDNNTNTTYTAGNGLSLSGTQFSHSDTSSQASVNNSGNTVIQDVTVDTYGHVTGLTSKALTLASLGYTGATNANYITNNNQLTNGAGYITSYAETDTLASVVGRGATTSATVQVGTLRATADVVAYYSSDERLKDNIKPIENALGKVNKLSGNSFTWNDKQDNFEGNDIGVIAQEVEAVFPELVDTRENGYKAVKYQNLVAVLIEAVKELSDKIETLENK